MPQQLTFFPISIFLFFSYSKGLTLQYEEVVLIVILTFKIEWSTVLLYRLKNYSLGQST